MKDIEFSEEQLGNLEAIGQQLFSDQSDPTSYAYKRNFVRPKINWLLIISFLLISLIIPAVAFFLTRMLSHSLLYSILCAALVYILFLAINLKRITVCLVKIYQRYAPDSIRDRCRFEPSCSEYMLLSIEKYGYFKGVKKGIDRLKRCNINNGGFDYP